ncbi:DUF7933 domain-containing protein [Telluria aromaticivorans]|uniref:DUF3494 domain-containing protein n=1 Tax=Telluria aromaticivorans TaxID=2725995 RepID=A0A7Y2JWX5_9BURK|nr:ice-binding family protein [Telluria aromaticivorans]NNG22531.1 DUF3494 domain-containing protein [Telluria aromaticivorans]
MLIMLCAAAPFNSAFAQVAPSLGTAGSFAVLGGQTVTNTGPTILNGDLGVFPGSAITGFPPGIVNGAIHAADAVAQGAQADTTIAYNSLASQPCNTTFGVPTDLSGMTLVPGVYCFASSASLTGTVTLDAQGDPNAVFIFKTGSTLITGSNATVALINGAQACNVFWQVGSSAVIGTGTNFVGNIVALTSITLTTNATLAGRALARNGSVTLDSNIVTPATCVAASVSVSKAFNPPTIAAGGTSTLTLTLSNTGSSAATLTAPFTDNLPTGLTVAATPNATTTCGGAVTTSTSSVTLTGGAIPANGSCTVSANVTATTGGAYLNTVAAGSLQTSNGSNTGPATATLTVTPVTPTSSVTLGKAFSPATIAKGGFSTLTLTLSNTGALPAIQTVPLVDTLPSGVVVASPANTTTTCGGIVTATPGGSTVTLSGGIIPANSSCRVTVRVTSNVAGYFTNTLGVGALQTTNGSNTAPAVATLTVIVKHIPPIVKKSFSPSTIKESQLSVLTITLINPNYMAASLIKKLVDTLPYGVQIVSSSYSGARTTCQGKVTAPNGGSTVTLHNGTIPAMGSCTITVKVTSYRKGIYVNRLKPGALQTVCGSNQHEATATLVVKSKY